MDRLAVLDIARPVKKDGKKGKGSSNRNSPRGDKEKKRKKEREKMDGKNTKKRVEARGDIGAFNGT